MAKRIVWHSVTSPAQPARPAPRTDSSGGEERRVARTSSVHRHVDTGRVPGSDPDTPDVDSPSGAET
jgi:hypothetical protein